jgi:hypothetical protein
LGQTHSHKTPYKTSSHNLLITVSISQY